MSTMQKPAPAARGGVTGAEVLVRTLIASGVDACFANPGTSEMHFVAALDRIDGMRCVLALFEGVATGAADGFARMAGRPASTLLHLGPGLGNGLAGLHNARRALSPVVNIVGDHATGHRRLDAPLQSDIDALARACSDWVRTVESPEETGTAAADAVVAARMPPGGISTLILPADCAWTPAPAVPAPAVPVPPRPQVDEARVEAAADALRKGRAALVLNGPSLHARPLELGGRIAAATGAELLTPTQVPRVERGAGRVFVDRIPYIVDHALKRLEHLERVVLVNAKPPVAFFAYPDRPGRLLPPRCDVLTLAEAAEDGVDALERLVDRLGAARVEPVREPLERRPLPSGDVTLRGIAEVVATLLPEDAIVVDESITSGRGLLPATRRSAPHDWLTNPGGAIGTALPLAIGAAIACPDRKVLVLESDGSGMYTLQGLWTMAREGLDVTIVVFNNRAYQILKGEFANVGAGEAGQRARDMLEIDRPTLDWLALSRGQGVPAVRADSLESFARALSGALTDRGPRLVELII
jgi:acetolactate synthase I/II/III large subunit